MAVAGCETVFCACPLTGPLPSDCGCHRCGPPLLPVGVRGADHTVDRAGPRWRRRASRRAR